MSPVALEWGEESSFRCGWMRKFEDLHYLTKFWGIKKNKAQIVLGA